MRALIASLILAITVTLPMLSQNSITISGQARDVSRPVSGLLNQLRKREKLAVTYEDPRYAKRSDMGRVGSEPTFTFSADELRSPEGAQLVVARMLREYGASGGLTFAVVKDGPRLHIIPSEVFNDSGIRVRQDSILDTVINLPAARRNGGQLLQAICDEVKKQTGYEIGIGPSAPGNSLSRYSSSEAVVNESARLALQNLLDHATPPGTFVWDLYYDPEDRGYGLNFAYVGLAAAPPGRPRK